MTDSTTPTSQVDFTEQAALIGQGPGVCRVAREDMLKLFAEIARLRGLNKQLAYEREVAHMREEAANTRYAELHKNSYATADAIRQNARNMLSRVSKALVVAQKLCDAHDLRQPQAGQVTTF